MSRLFASSLLAMFFLALGTAAGFSMDGRFLERDCAVGGQCYVCHSSMNGKQDDRGMAVLSQPDARQLRESNTVSDICLDCHQNYGQRSFDGNARTPGGDFYWTTRAVTSTSPSGESQTVEGREHGHNINAPKHGLLVDDTLRTAPGGTYESAKMGCTSCHDPHGSTNFMSLYGEGPTAAGYPGGYEFSNPAPIAISAGGSGDERIGRHTAYISGMSDWCGNCHAGMHSGMTSNKVHMVDRNIGSRISANYNRYVTTGNMTGGQAAAYLPLVPFEDPLNTTSSTTGTTSTSKVMCLTCHRAHASPHKDAGRWDMEQRLVADGQPMSAPYLAQYNGKPLDFRNQRNLCNKCHAQDINDRLAAARP